MSDPLNTASGLEHRMQLAIQAAQIGLRIGQSPFGAAIFNPHGNLVVAAHNEVRAHVDPTAHAEVVAIRLACRKVGSKSLKGFWLFATCEPCPMCAAATVFAGIEQVVFGASVADARKAGFGELQEPCGTIFDVSALKPNVYPGVLYDDCVALFCTPD